jgi:ATP:ADP antiporter, AAA family
MQAKASSRIISFLKAWIISFLKELFGDFQKEELKKFLKLGGIFAFVIGVYWTLRPLKDSIFASMVGVKYQPAAKWVSLILLLPLVIVYSKLIGKFSREHLFYVIGTAYIIGVIAFGLLFYHPTIGLANTQLDWHRYIGWLWYVFVESYGSIVVALFWAFAADLVSPNSAKKGFPIVVMLGQLGAILGPKFLTPLGKNVFGTSAPTVLICALLIALMMFGVYLFMRTTPKSELASYHGHDKGAAKEVEPGFFEGLILLVKQPYLLGIFGVIGIYEIIVTIIDYNFKFLVCTEYATEAARSAYLGDYAVMVNVVSFLCLLFGISNIQRRLGIKVSLVLMPFVVLGMVLSFKAYPVVHVLFWIMVAAKAINYALNSPALKTLYVPTSHDVKYKSQAWIETFGSRGSKATGSGVNMLQGPFTKFYGLEAGQLAFIAFSSYLSFGLLAAWVIIALYLGKTYEKAVEQNKLVC